MAKWETEAEENHRLRQMRINEMKSKSAEEAGESALSAGTDPALPQNSPTRWRSYMEEWIRTHTAWAAV